MLRVVEPPRGPQAIQGWDVDVRHVGPIGGTASRGLPKVMAERRPKGDGRTGQGLHGGGPLHRGGVDHLLGPELDSVVLAKISNLLEGPPDIVRRSRAEVACENGAPRNGVKGLAAAKLRDDEGEVLAAAVQRAQPEGL